MRWQQQVCNFLFLWQAMVFICAVPQDSGTPGETGTGMGTPSGEQMSTVSSIPPNTVFVALPWLGGALIVESGGSAPINCTTKMKVDQLYLEVGMVEVARGIHLLNRTYHLNVTEEYQMKDVVCVAELNAGAQKTQLVLGVLLVNSLPPRSLTLDFPGFVGLEMGVRIGSVLNISCQVSTKGDANGVDLFFVHITRNGTRTVRDVTSTNCAFSVGLNNFTATLTINPFTRPDIGAYECFARQGTFTSSNTINITQLALPAPVVTLEPDTDTITTVEGPGKLILRCFWDTGSFPLYVTWHRNGLYLEGCSLSATSCDIELNPPKLGRDEGKYTCSASNENGTSSKSIQVLINAPVVLVPILSSLLNLFASGNEQVLLRCDIMTGFPLPIIAWSFQEFPCTNSTDCQPDPTKWRVVGSDIGTVIPTMDQPTNSSSLTLTRLSAFFRCRANNTISQVQRLFSVRRTEISSRTIPSLSAGLIAGIVTVIIVLILCIFAFILYKRKLDSKFAPYLEPNIYEMDPKKTLSEQSGNLPYDPDWEFPRSRITKTKILGSGAFGEVWLAEAIGILAVQARDKSLGASKRREIVKRTRRFKFETSANTDFLTEQTKVAVKTVKATASHSEYKDLASELKILIHVGSHKNIVNLLGACTVGGPLYIILEYCSRGNLRDYLQEKKDSYNPSWQSDAKGLSGNLTYTALTAISFQISKGMEFLSSQKCVHRDLAARNILISEDYVMKISDFGLARDIMKDNLYLKKSSTKEPIKWMAYESLAESEYTTQSDIWAYGVLLWEIFSFGATPYPGLKNEDVYFFLASGSRLDQPNDCPDEIFEIMKKCWLKNPKARLPFADIASVLDKLLLNHSSEDDPYLVFDEADFDGVTTKSKVPVSLEDVAVERNHPTYVRQSPIGKTDSSLHSVLEQSVSNGNGSVNHGYSSSNTMVPKITDPSGPME